MMDPATLAVGAVILLAGYVLGRHTRTPRRARYICDCRHPLATHDPRTGRCNHAEMRSMFDIDPTPCSCVQYVGERPLDLDALNEQAARARHHIPE